MGIYLIYFLVSSQKWDMKRISITTEALKYLKKKSNYWK